MSNIEVQVMLGVMISSCHCLSHLSHFLPHDKFLDWSKLKAFTDDHILSKWPWGQNLPRPGGGGGGGGGVTSSKHRNKEGKL